MKKEEAILKMKEGKKVTHDYFSDSEWVTIKDGKIHFEDGNICEESEFWRWRKTCGWNDGYSIFKPK